jgi:predicted nuclease of predicted toxin-antitoxin system
MLLLLDMNLPPSLASTLRDAGHQVFHWCEVGAASAPDSEVLAWAKTRNAILLTHDLDFGAILAASKAHGPSVVQIRRQDVLGESFRLTIGAPVSGCSRYVDSSHSCPFALIRG